MRRARPYPTKEAWKAFEARMKAAEKWPTWSVEWRSTMIPGERGTDIFQQPDMKAARELFHGRYPNREIVSISRAD